MIVSNSSRHIILAAQAELADTFFSRMQGLLGRRTLSDGQALIITHCNSIHMFFMQFPIDVLFLDPAGRVVGVVKDIRPFQLSPIFWSANRAIELPAGTITRTATALGDIIEIK